MNKSTTLHIDSKKLLQLQQCLEDIEDAMNDAIARMDGLHAIVQLTANSDAELSNFHFSQLLDPHLQPLEGCCSRTHLFLREAGELVNLILVEGKKA